MIYLTLLTTAVLISFTGNAHAQAAQDHQQHHPGAPATQAQPAPTQPPAALPPAAQPPAAPQMQMPMGQMMQGMPEQCRGMMQNMQSCMGVMHQMMQGRMGQGGTMPGQMGPAMQHPTTGAASTKAYLEAAHKMHEPMMQGVQAPDPDVAFVRGMIPHHQGAIDMAKVLLQYGKDPQTKKWANEVIREQQREIGEMEEWLKKNAR
jgi:uncharacterized protein (DUF305 family)